MGFYENGEEKKCCDCSLEEVLAKFSIFKRYHLQIAVLLFLGFAANTIYSTNYVFITVPVGYRCKNNVSSSNNCTEWEYDDPNSFVAEFDLANQEWKRTLVGSVHSFGTMAGLLLVGPLSDRFGRKWAIVATGTMGGLIGLAKSFSPWYWLYCTFEFLEAAIGDCCSPCFIIMIEMLSAKQKLKFSLLCVLGHPFGLFLTSLAAWLLPYFRTYLRVLYAPSLLFIFYSCLLDESPRWLLTKGKKEQAVKVLEKAAKKNKIKIERKMLENISNVENVSKNLFTVLKVTFKSRTLQKRFFVCLVWWITSIFVNYGMTINSVSLAGNKYVNYTYLGIVEIVGSCILVFTLTHFKRKIPLIVCFFTAAIICIAQPFTPQNLPWLSILLYMVGRLMNSLYFGITYVFTSELFPTYSRNSLHALCSSLGRLGSIIAPQTPLLMYIWPGLPAFVFGLASTFAGLLTLIVPDISNQALPDTVQQAEQLEKTKVSKAILPTISNNVDSSRL